MINNKIDEMIASALKNRETDLLMRCIIKLN